MIISALKKKKHLYKNYRYLKDYRDTWTTPNTEGSLKVINLLANDICNSKCSMCNIWQQKKGFELSPNDLSTILKDNLFSQVSAVGITGGEPTLKENLPQLYEVCCDNLPKLKGLSLITNAIKYEQVKRQILLINKIVLDRSKSFTVMISLDGLEQTHDNQRGHKGNFKSALKLLKFLQSETEIPVLVGCTITKSNVYEVDALLDWLIENKIYGRFRVAEFISRLYNSELTQEIRNFNEDESYHLACFFHRLKNTYETNPKYKRTYDSIISVLTSGKRTIGCPYHTNGVVLDSKGELLYCAPKSKTLGSALTESASTIYENNKQELNRIKKQHCNNCIHDYHAPATQKEYSIILNRFKWRLLLNHKISKYTLPFIRRKKVSNQPKADIFIIGWYGTETVGDKAILGDIINKYNVNGDKNIVIASLNPFVTIRTLKELNLQGKVIDTYSQEFIDYSLHSKITLMGGGPLMQMSYLTLPLDAFKLSKRNNNHTVIYGCGIGPIYDHKHENILRKILLLSDEVKLRDSDSVIWANRLSPQKTIVQVNDPAKQFVLDRSDEIIINKKKQVFACFLREWSKEYAHEMSTETYLSIRKTFERNLATSIKSFCSEFKLLPVFYSMHTFHQGGDDRSFNRRFTNEHFQNYQYKLENKPSSVDMIIEAMKESSYNLCMRFHSVLFAHTLKTNFFAIDYTRGGKIKSFLNDSNSLNNYHSLEDIAASDEFNFKPVSE